MSNTPTTTLRDRIEALLPLFTLAEQTANGDLSEPLMLEDGETSGRTLALFTSADKAQHLWRFVGEGWSVVTFATLEELAAWLRVARRFAPNATVDPPNSGDSPRVPLQRILDAINRR